MLHQAASCDIQRSRTSDSPPPFLLSTTTRGKKQKKEKTRNMLFYWAKTFLQSDFLCRGCTCAHGRLCALEARALNWINTRRKCIISPFHGTSPQRHSATAEFVTDCGLGYYFILPKNRICKTFFLERKKYIARILTIKGSYYKQLTFPALFFFLLTCELKHQVWIITRQSSLSHTTALK